ncbi:MAG: hypothetical protein Q7S87_09110 [Agitococcus sp.]|nr:hypothetical protein [Agitococcus sp.]
MTTPHPLQLKYLTEKNAKALASSITKFLKGNSIAVPHALALELAGSLCGFADWHGLKTAIAQKEIEEAQKPKVMKYEDFLASFRPLQNHLDSNATADGFGFNTSGAEFNFVKEVYAKNPLCVWTCIEGEGTSWIASGLHHVNRLFYIITNKPAKGPLYDIAYGHDEGDLCFELSVLNPETHQSEVIDTKYGSTVEEVLELANIDYTEEIAGIVEEGQSRVIIVKQLKPCPH